MWASLPYILSMHSYWPLANRMGNALSWVLLHPIWWFHKLMESHPSHQYGNLSNMNLLRSTVRTLVSKSANFFNFSCFKTQIFLAATASQHFGKQWSDASSGGLTLEWRCFNIPLCFHRTHWQYHSTAPQTFSIRTARPPPSQLPPSLHRTLLQPCLSQLMVDSCCTSVLVPCWLRSTPQSSFDYKSRCLHGSCQQTWRLTQTLPWIPEYCLALGTLHDDINQISHTV